MDTTVPLFAALWLGILTAISPCPLATNIAAVSFISRQVSRRTTVILSGIAYTIGRAITYGILGFLLVRTAVDVPALSMFLQTYINRFLGILLVLVGMFLLELIPFNFPSLNVSDRVAERLGRVNVVGPLLLV
jgi:cytochrome c-type biogenesis protein